MKAPGAQLYLALAHGLANDMAWPVPTPNFIRYDELQGDQTPDKLTEADGDFPKAVLEGPISGRSNLYTTDETFSTYSDTPPTQWQETGQYKFRLTLTSDSLNVNQYDRLPEETLNAIRRLGPRLGLKIPMVTGVKAEWSTKEVFDTDQVRRMQTDMVITVDTDIDGSELVEDQTADT